MKSSIVTIAIAAIAITTSVATALAAEEVLIQGQKSAQGSSIGVKARDACVESFVNVILPADAGRSIRVIDHNDEFDQAFNPKSIVGPSAMLDISLEARLNNSNALLATGLCTVNKGAKVVRLDTKLPDQTKLAGLRAHDIRIVAAT